MLHIGLDLSRPRIDVCVVDEAGCVVEQTAVHNSLQGMTDLVWQTARHGDRVRAVVESMNGARFVHDTLEELGWDVEVADAAKVKGFGPIATKTDRIDAWVLAELSRRDLVPAIWLPSPAIRAGRELARLRMHLVKHRTMFKNRIHSNLITWAVSVPVSDLFGDKGRQLLTELTIPCQWRHSITVCLEEIDHLDRQIAQVDGEIRSRAANDPDCRLLQTAPGIGPILGYIIATEIGDITRFPTPKQLVGYTGLIPRVHQSGNNDYRGTLTGNGPALLRWALIEATTWAQKHDTYRTRHQRIKQRRGKQQGTSIARVDTARRLTTAIWWMLTKDEPFNPKGPVLPLVA